MEIKSITEEMRQAVKDLVKNNWGAPLIVSKGKVYYMDQLTGYMAVNNGEIKGLITYSITNDECEIVSLDSLSENMGIGRELINCVIKDAKKMVVKECGL